MKTLSFINVVVVIPMCAVFCGASTQLRAETLGNDPSGLGTIYTETTKWRAEMEKYEGEWISSVEGCKAELRSDLRLTVNSNGRWKNDPKGVLISRQMDFLVSGARYELFVASEPEPVLLLIQEGDEASKRPDCIAFVRPNSKNIPRSDHVALSNSNIGWRLLLVKLSKEWECSATSSRASINYRTIKFSGSGKLKEIDGYSVLLGQGLTFFCGDVLYRVNILNDSLDRFSLLRREPGAPEFEAYEFISK